MFFFVCFESALCFLGEMGDIEQREYISFSMFTLFFKRD